MRTHSRLPVWRGVFFALLVSVSSSVYAQTNGAPPPPGTESCPAPQTMGSDFRCHCPKGSDLIGGHCVSTACPKGQALNANGQCEAIPVKPCPEGKERNAMGQCVLACAPPRKLDAAGRCA